MDQQLSEEMEEFLQTYLVQNLSIQVRNTHDYYSKGVEVALLLNGKEISSDSITVSSE